MESTLIQVIKLYEDFASSSGTKPEKDNLVQFVAFLNDRVQPKADFSDKISMANWKNFSRKTLLEMTMAYLGKMNRYVDNYGRKNLATTSVGTIEEFTYLIPLLDNKVYTKSDLIQQNGHPITTGTDIIKRLIGKKYIAEKTNPNDKRSIHITITKKGQQAIFKSSDILNQLSLTGAGILSNKELISLLGMLQKLDHFHDRVHKTHKELVLSEIVADYRKELHV
jgi:DNA-binding MarR family transcriptional regulator